jgi:hypothetical protein
MIAPDARVGKGQQEPHSVAAEPMEASPPRRFRSCDKMTARHHGFVNGIIMLPDSGQAHAKLEWD